MVLSYLRLPGLQSTPYLPHQLAGGRRAWAGKGPLAPDFMKLIIGILIGWIANVITNVVADIIANKITERRR